MIITMDKSGSIVEFKKLINDATANENTRGIFILSCDKNDYAPEVIKKIVQDVKTPVFGGIFPEIIYGKEKLDTGVVIVSLSKKPTVAVIERLSHPDADFERQIEEQLSDATDFKTIFVFVDGMSNQISLLINEVFNKFGPNYNYMGGGAGSLSYKQKPCLFTNQGLVKDSAVIALMNIQSGIGVSHGWKTIAGPYKVTKATKNIIMELNWKPAFELYRDIIRIHSGKTITRDNFFEISKLYPLGLKKASADKIVREPLMLDENGSLVCIGDVPRDSFIDILNGNSDSLISGAQMALALSRDAFDTDKRCDLTFFIDSISQALFLADKFSLELDTVYNDDNPFIGALTIGEIANNGKNYLEFHNKTTIVGVLEE